MRKGQLNLTDLGESEFHWERPQLEMHPVFRYEQKITYPKQRFHDILVGPAKNHSIEQKKENREIASQNYSD